MLPFTRQQFFALFADYNRAIWPAQVLAYLLALVVLAVALRRPRDAERAVPALVALMWGWTGMAYHALFFFNINTAALGFAALFVLQALLFTQVALAGGLRFAPRRDARALWGWLLVGYAGVAYPLLGISLGHGWPALPMFGVAPCPVTLFTFGVLLLAREPVPRRLLVIPLLWGLIGGSAAFLLAVPQDWPLLIGAALVVPWLWRRARVVAAKASS
jgi:Family of unknown function (DUF6064)